jgi:WD40 repeat protein/GTPase SAR1 family protein
VLCLSPGALASEWVALERSTVLFRDPTNADRRFIPLLLEDCELPDTLRRYRYVDYRRESDNELKELLAACLPERAATTSPPVGRARRADTAIAPSFVLGPDRVMVLERTMLGHLRGINSVAVSPDGTWMASGSSDTTVKIWNLQTGEVRATLKKHTREANCVAITASGLVLSGSSDSSVCFWDPQLRFVASLSRPGSVKSLAPVAAGRLVLSATSGPDQDIELWDAATGECVWEYPVDEVIVNSCAVSELTRRAITGGSDGTVDVRDLDRGSVVSSLSGHTAAVTSVDITRDGRFAISGSADMTVRTWDMTTYTCVGIFEGHGSPVTSVALSPDSKLVASAGLTDHSVRIWDRESGACLQVITDVIHHGGSMPKAVAFAPDGRRLVVGTVGGRINVYRVVGDAVRAHYGLTRRYVNAKIVLVGESGVGKSGLAHRLIEDRFVQTHSTHGMQVWRLDLPLELDETTEREALLWDLAGQEDYRLIHQLFLDETALALLLFNPQHDDPFAEIGVWLKVLHAVTPKDRTREVEKLLVAARIDVGNVKVSRQKIDRFMEQHGIAAYLPTSARRGDNCSDAQSGGPSPLKRLIAEHVSWSSLPWTSTPRLLADLKNAVVEMTEQRAIRLLRFAELAQRLEQALPGEKFGDTDVRTAVTLLGNHGVVMPLKFGDLVLLRPDLLNGYAAAVIRAARDHTDEIGCVSERAVFDRAIDLSGVDRLDAADEELLMRALVQTFLDRSLCIAEETPEGRHLVFPSQYRRERPIPAHPEVFVSYTFAGEWQTVYTTLVVRLWYSREFRHHELWRNAAELKTTKGHTAGLLIERAGEGEGTIGIFFDAGVPDELKVTLIEYVHRHLEKHAADVRRDRRYVCPSCGRPAADREAVRERLAAGKDFVYCQWCDAKVLLVDHIEQRLAEDPVARRVLRMDQRATRELDAEALVQILTGHMMAVCGEANQLFRQLPASDVGGDAINGEVEFRDDAGTPSGKKIHVHLRIAPNDPLTERRPGEPEAIRLDNPRLLEAWARHPGDVYVVVRDGEGTIRWMNATRVLRERAGPVGRQVVFDGEKLDAPAVWRVRDAYFPR